MDFGGYCAFTYPSQSQPEHPHTCTVTCTTTRRIGTNPAQPSPFSTILFNPTHPMPDAVGRTGQIACSAATHLIHRPQYCFLGLPTCSSLALATGCCRPVIGLWEGAIPRTVEKRNGEDLEGVGTGPGPETGAWGTGTHLIDFCTLNSNDGGPIADSTSRKHIACTSLLYRRRTLINQGCQSHAVPSPLSFSLFFRLLQRPEILHRLSQRLVLPSTHSFETYALCLVIVISAPQKLTFYRTNLRCHRPPPSGRRKEGKTSRNPQIPVVRQSCSNISNIKDFTRSQELGRTKEVKRRLRKRGKGKGGLKRRPNCRAERLLFSLRRTPLQSSPAIDITNANADRRHGIAHRSTQRR